MIRWFARNDIATNFLILAILLWGGYSAIERVPLEVQPALRFNRVDIWVPYRGGSPAGTDEFLDCHLLRRAEEFENLPV